jgi:multiple sugar transport system ATP-binding protein
MISICAGISAGRRNLRPTLPFFTCSVVAFANSHNRETFIQRIVGRVPARKKELLIMASVVFSQASRIYPGTTKPAVDKLDLTVNDGEFLVLVGPSGCGKSTSLRMLAGLEEIDTGSIRIGDKDVTNVAPKDRDIAMVFQSYALYPHMSVAENMGFALKIAGIAKEERDRRVKDAAKLLDLEDYLDRKPKALSGGQRQRVAMGRAIVREPQVFLMDEPLSNLDAKLRVATRTQIAALQRRLGITTVYVTHDQVEAMTMGDRVAVLKDGVLQQVDTPRNLYEKPQNAFVAGFIGSPAMNLLTAPVSGGKAMLGSLGIAVPSSASSSVTVGIRPEGFAPAATGFEVAVEVVEELGADAFVYGKPVDKSLKFANTSEELGQVIIRWDPKSPPKPGQTVTVGVNSNIVHLFDAASGKRLN